MSEDNEFLQILLVDDEESIRHYLQLVLRAEGYHVLLAEDASSAIEQLKTTVPDLILCDIRMPGKMDGLGLLDWIKNEQLKSEIIMMSAYGTREIAIKAVRAGAYDYIDKPIRRDDLLLTFSKFFEREKLRRENKILREELKRKTGEGEIINASLKMQKVLDIAKKVALYPSTVLVVGETGTGKELIARFIHDNSDRNSLSFVAVNCGSLPSELLESELFGHSKGSFTGAHKEHIGLFEVAHKGTLFLDEISELPIQLQVKLLRVLQEGVIRRVGETSTHKVDVRIIAATNRDLDKLVEEGLFREDLYHRLEVFRITIPPLRERTEDIPVLVESFLNYYNDYFVRDVQGVDPKVMRLLMSYHWPGNVRELKNVIERAVVLEDSSVLTVASLHHKLFQEVEKESFDFLEGSLSIKKGTRLLERHLIKLALAKTDGNRSMAARILEISHRALLYKIKDYKLN